MNHENTPRGDARRCLLVFGKCLVYKFKESDLHEIVDITTNVLIVILGVVGAYIYGGQLLEMRHTNKLTQQSLDGNASTLSQTLAKMQAQVDATERLYGEAQKQTAFAGKLALNSNESALAASRSADAAKKSAYTAAEQLEIFERPWLAPNLERSPFRVGDGSQGVAWQIWIKNFGTSPALHVRWHIRLYVTDTSTLTLDDLRRTIENIPIESSDPQRSIMAGQESANTGASNPPLYYNSDFKAADIAGARHLILGGRILYRDPLNNPHETTFCLIYTPPSSVFAEGWTSCSITTITN